MCQASANPQEVRSPRTCASSSRTTLIQTPLTSAPRQTALLEHKGSIKAGKREQSGVHPVLHLGQHGSRQACLAQVLELIFKGVQRNEQTTAGIDNSHHTRPFVGNSDVPACCDMQFVQVLRDTIPWTFRCSTAPGHALCNSACPGRQLHERNQEQLYFEATESVDSSSQGTRNASVILELGAFP